MKKWMLPIIVLWILAIGVWFLWGDKSTLHSPSTGFLDEVPGEIDQVMYIKVDNSLIELMEKIESQTGYTWQPLAAHLKGVQSLLVGQFLTQGDPVNILFVKADDELSINELQQVGVIAVEETYTSQKIWSNTWAYGDPIALEYLDTYKGDMLNELTGAQLWSEGMQWGTYNVWFLSRGKGGWANPLVAQFGKKLEYTMALSHLALQQSEGNIIMQFSPWTLHPWASNYEPKLATLVKSDPLVYVEFQDILGVLWLSDAQVITLLPIIMAQLHPTFVNLLAKDDYYDIVSVLHDNVALSLDVTSGGGIWLWAAVIFNSPKAGILAGVLKPVLSELVDKFLWSWAIEERITDEWFTLSVAIPWLEAVLWQSPLVSFEKLSWDSSWSILSILIDPTMILGKWVQWLVHVPESIASFSIDTKAMERLQKSAPEASLDGLAAGQYLTQGVIKWHIILDEATQQVRLIYKVVDGE